MVCDYFIIKKKKQPRSTDLMLYLVLCDDDTMLRTVDEIRAELSPSLKRLLDDIFLDANNDTRPLMFGDEQEFKAIKRVPFPVEMNACFDPSSLDRFIIFLKQIDKISPKEQDDIAHELGHLWLLFLGLPSEPKSSDKVRQARWDTFFSPLRDTMEHAVYYPLIKDKYQINLYKTGNERLANFITDQLPNIGNESVSEKLFLILNYIKYEVESDNTYWLKKLKEIYSKKALDVMKVVENMLHLIQKLAMAKDAQLFTSQYRKVLGILDIYYGIPKEIWPTFVTF